MEKYSKICNLLNSYITFYPVSNKNKNTILSLFTSILISVASLIMDLSNRSSLSILTIPNAYLTVDNHLSLAALADIFRSLPLPPLVPFLVQPSQPPPFQQTHHHASSNHRSRHQQLWLRESHRRLLI